MKILHAFAVATLLSTATLGTSHANELQARTFPSSAGALKVDVVAEGLAHPWSLAFMPDGNMLVTERPGRMRIVTPEGKIMPPIENVPAVYTTGQGGLLDVILHPQFKQNRILYFAYAEGDEDKASTAVASARLKDNALEEVNVIFRQMPKVSGPNHWGARLVLDDDEKLYIALGERYNQSEKAQDLSTHMGKVVRIETDGSLPKDNPFAGDENVMPEIWSYGHRNMQGAALHPKTKALWTHEHGPRGGDEVNIIQPGRNYGWPEASYGSHYSLLPIPDDHTKRGFTEPVYKWNPSIAPSGMLFYGGKQFPDWQGDLFVGALAGQMLVRLDVQEGKIVEEEQLLKELHARIRDVREGPDGYIYLLTDSPEGRILRLSALENAKKQ